MRFRTVSFLAATIVAVAADSVYACCGDPCCYIVNDCCENGALTCQSGVCIDQCCRTYSPNTCDYVDGGLCYHKQFCREDMEPLFPDAPTCVEDPVGSNKMAQFWTCLLVNGSGSPVFTCSDEAPSPPCDGTEASNLYIGDTLLTWGCETCTLMSCKSAW